ncbi:MAG: DUF1800 family protein [Burkholderiaceae bacterium]|jgi:uncharacterized protein (DUF1800 family)
MDHIDLADKTKTPTNEAHSTASSTASNTRILTQLSATAAVSTFLAACGGGTNGDTSTTTSSTGTEGSETGSANEGGGNQNGGGTPSAPISAKQAARFLTQAQFSASDSDIAAVQSQGYSAWLDQQFNASIPQTAWDWLIMKGLNTFGLRLSYAVADKAIWQQLMSSGGSVRKRVALALSEIFVVSMNGSIPRPRSFAIAGYWDMLVANAFGNYRVLLESITLNATMGYYLNTKGNQKADPKTGRQPDENYGREVMQLFSIGLNQLNLDGTIKRDSFGQPISTYDQNDVVNIARMFTGWDLDMSAGFDIPNAFAIKLPMVLNQSKHSPEAATFLGVTVPANTDGKTALKITLDTLFNHPNVGPFICKQLIQRLVTSNPSPSYVARVAAVFNKNSANERGNLKSVIKAILLDDEARSDQGLTQATFGRIREPMVRFIQWGRTFNAKSADDIWSVSDLTEPSTKLGQSPFRSPTVFNYFRPGYVPPNTDMSKDGLTAPEFQLVNEITVAGYLNFMPRFVSNGTNLVADYSAELALVNDPAALVKRLVLLLSANQISDATMSSIQNAISTIDVKTATGKNNRLYAALTLVLSAPEYIVQK